MTKNRRYHQALLQAIEDRFPGVGAKIGIRSKHHQVTLSYEGQSRFVVFPASPSDGSRGLQRTLNDVRKELRGMGAIQ